ncbi:MAG: phosphopantothenoylcysteine decarboxylase [Planctomycetes bacterium]|nr:phosphopantothenoylcysteine decarboxylase [Planctomycetota bacterium]
MNAPPDPAREQVPFAPTRKGVRLLITAGPTHEPIDAVRYLGNRSSGRLGIALAEAGVERGWETTLLLGPTPRRPANHRVRVHRFQTTCELQGLLAEHFPACDVLVMAAAVADYRPRLACAHDTGEFDAVGPLTEPDLSTKIRRGSGPIRLELEPTPDLLAEVSGRRQPHHRLVGFALEPEERLMSSARDKLARKGLDAIVANPLETMDAPSIRATVLFADGRIESTPDAGMTKEAFAPWLLDRLPRP